MSPADIFLTLLAGLTAGWIAIYSSVLLWLWRRYVGFMIESAKRVAEGARRRRRTAFGRAAAACLAMAWTTCLAIFVAPLLLVLAPLRLGGGAFLVAAHLIFFH